MRLKERVEDEVEHVWLVGLFVSPALLVCVRLPRRLTDALKLMRCDVCCRCSPSCV